MTTLIQFANFAATTLASGIAAGDLSLVVAAGQGALFPALSGGKYFYVTLVDALTGATREIVKVTALATDTMTIVRAQDGTSASAFITGDKVELRLVKASENTAIRNDEFILTANKTLTVSESATIAATTITLNGNAQTFPAAAATIARTDAAQTFTGNQSFAGDVILTGAGKGIIFEGTTADAFETTLLAGEPTADINVTMPVAASTTLAGLAITETFTAPQRGTITTNNTITAIDCNVTNFVFSTPAAGAALTFTNIAAGMGGTIKFVNGSNYAITAAATTKVTSTFLATISVTGTYIISWFSDGTNVYCSTAGAMA